MVDNIANDGQIEVKSDSAPLHGFADGRHSPRLPDVLIHLLQSQKAKVTHGVADANRLADAPAFGPHGGSAGSDPLAVHLGTARGARMAKAVMQATRAAVDRFATTS